MREKLKSCGYHVVMMALALLWLIPLLWTLVISLSSNSSLKTNSQILVPTEPTLSNYADVFRTGWSMVPQLDDRLDHCHGHYGDHLRCCRLCIREASLPRANHCLRTDLGRNDGSQGSDVRSPLHDVFRGRAGEFLYCVDFPPCCLPLRRVHHDAILLAGAKRNGGSGAG